MARSKTSPSTSRPPKSAAAPEAKPAPPKPAASSDQKAAYERHLAAARALDSKQVRPLRTDPQLALQAALQSVAAVERDRAQVEAALGKPAAKVLDELPSLGAGLVYAAQRAAALLDTPSAVPALLLRAHELRSLLLATAEALALAGLFDRRAVEKIKRGYGAIDVAADCVALATLYEDHAAKLRGRSPVTAAQVREALEVGGKLHAQLARTGTKKGSRGNPERAAATELRDRFWTLLVRAHEQLWRVAAYTFGRDGVDARVRSLYLRARSKPAAKTADAAKPQGAAKDAPKPKPAA